MNGEGRFGPYRMGRKLRYLVRHPDGHVTYEVLGDLYGPWLKHSFNKKRTPKRTKRPRKWRRASGWVYFIQCGGERGPVKIGCAGDVTSRMYSMQSANPYELVLLVKIWIASDCEEYEQQMLKRFEHQKIRGEWLEWSVELQEFVDDVIKLGQFEPDIETDWNEA